MAPASLPLLLLLPLLSASLLSPSHALSCLSPSGAAVDWWLMIKHPDSTTASYSDATGHNVGLSSNADLSQAGNALQRTVSQRSGAGVGSILYNDESPADAAWAYGPEVAAGVAVSRRLLRRRLLSEQTSTYGHTKGVVLVDADSGMWLVHSTPRYPLVGSDSFPSDELIYAQSFLCVSLAAAEMAKVGTALLLNKPSVYSSSLPGDLGSKYPTLQSVLNKEWVTDPQATTLALESAQGMQFVAFAKNKEWGKRLYADLVAPHFGGDMLVESWRRPPMLPPYCPSSGPTVGNVQNVTIGGESWEYTHDHSKWGVVENQSIVCVGDINRMSSQEERGGGTVCFTHGGLWNTFYNSIGSVAGC
eukprot:CAMPEP_0196769964 /NCGR_PEP_ID=MMETSP1104-20130614/845_1 /TAXON_ID=33652 /ORGANISM="Cafeteria sp., Strain Caron Lab Isolate" /LENGTH=360 /DNA_ID=CAMNT_0042140067 /DNA_START=1 /DNA_END=1083 /DNA_ORIENTATION=-